MRVTVSGASGLIGSHLVVALREAGHDVRTLVRRPPRQPGEVQWDPAVGRLDPADLAGTEAVVHLAGAGIGEHRWTPRYRAHVRSSRVNGTRLLADMLSRQQPMPAVWLSGSAIGYYGDTGEQAVDEQAPAGAGFLAGVCQDWEAATSSAEQAGIRVCHLRTGIVLSASGGALAKQLPLYRLGLGGPLGSGRQYQSWISLTDEVAAIRFLLDHAEVRGPVNLTAPQPVPQQEFAQTLGRVLHRPALLPAPAVALRVAVGGFADEGLLTGQRVLPRVLGGAGFRFAYPDLDSALRAALSQD